MAEVAEGAALLLLLLLLLLPLLLLLLLPAWLGMPAPLGAEGDDPAGVPATASLPSTAMVQEAD